MESFFRGIIRFRYLVIVLILACTGLAWMQLQSLRFEGDADAFIPQNDPVMSYNDLVEERFGIRDLIIVGVLNNNPAENGVFNPRTLATIKDFSEKIALLPGIKAIRAEDVASVSTLDNITGTADGMAVDPFMETVPHSPESLDALKQALFHNSMFVNWIVSQDGTGMLIVAKMEPGGGTAEGTARRMAIYNTIRDMVAAKKAAGAPEDFHIAGQGAMEVTFEEGMRRDMETFMPLIIVIVLGTLFFTYRSVRGVLLPLAVVIVSVIWTLGIMAAVGVPMYSVSTMMPVVLMAVGVADGIHILSRYYDEVLEHPGVSSPDAVLVAMREMWQPVVFTSLTTAAGFLSFLTASILPIRYFGVFTALGVVAALVFSLTFFPALLSLLPAKVSRGLREQMGRSGDLAATGVVARLLSRLGVSVARKPLVVWGSTACVMLVCLLGAQRVFVDTSFIKMADPTSPVRVADTVLGQTFQGNLPLYIAIEGHQPDLLKDPVLLSKLDRLQALVEQDPVVGGSLSLAEYVKRMNRVMNEDRAEMEVVPTSRDLVAQYLLLYSFSGDPDDFDEVVDYDYQHANVTFYLRSDGTRDIQRVINRIQDFAVHEFGRSEQDDGTDAGWRDMLFLRFGRWLGNIEPTITGWDTNSGFRLGFAGAAYLTIRFNDLVVAGQLSSLVTSLVGVFLLTTFMFRSFVAGLINIIPISLVIVFSFGLMGLLGIPLEVGKSLTASMVIGIGIDYTIHFLNKYRLKVHSGFRDPEQITATTMATSGKAIFFNAVVVIGGFAVFLTSSFTPNFYLGAMLVLNMSACLLVSMTVLPVVLNTFKPRFVYGPEAVPAAVPVAAD
jgi:predicted RND superfamily exporter protein